MGVDRAYVSGLELGGRNPTIVTLWHLAQALEVRFAELFLERSGASKSGQKKTFGVSTDGSRGIG
jgi:transcriptional regulator with XRE-family HTH domain